MFTHTASGAPNVVCGAIRDAMRAYDFGLRHAAHLDAAVERIVHAMAGTRESVTVTVDIALNESFAVRFA